MGGKKNQMRTTRNPTLTQRFNMYNYSLLFFLKGWYVNLFEDRSLAPSSPNKQHNHKLRIHSMSHLRQENLFGYERILKNHILLLANADITVPLYQNNDSEISNNNDDEYDINSPNLRNENVETAENSIKDSYSNFFNCLVENDFFLSMDKVNKIINNNEIKYICFGNRLNFLNLIKFFSFKTVRLITILTTKNYDDIDKFTEHIETLLKCVRFLTKLMPIFFEVCYNEVGDEEDQYFTEDEIFWNANTSETYQDLNKLTQDATMGAPDSIMSFDKLNKSPVSSKETEKSISSLNVEINFKARQNPDEFSTQPNWFLDGIAQKNNLPLGVSLLTALLKVLFMEGFALPLTSTSSLGNISFRLWNSDTLDTNGKSGYSSQGANPTLDSNRFEIMDLLQVLFSNSLYSSKKIDNKFLACWCCSMPEYLSVYFINSLLNNFVDENTIIAKSNLTVNKDVHNTNFNYPPEYNIIKYEILNTQNNSASKKSIFKQNFVLNNDLESSLHSKDLFDVQKSSFLPNLNNHTEKPLTVEESSKLRENFFKAGRNILLLYFTFDPNSVTENTKFQIAKTSLDVNDLSNVCLRLFSGINTISDYRRILVSIVKVLKLPINMAIEDDTKIFNLNNKPGSSFFDLFNKSTFYSSDNNQSNSSKSDNTALLGETKTAPITFQSITSILLIFKRMLESNEFFETHTLEVYSNKLFFILLFYLKNYHRNPTANSTFMTTLESLLVRLTSNPIFSLKSMKFINVDYYTEKVPKCIKLIDKDLNISNETHRDFFIKHVCQIIIKDIETNQAPKINLYHILNNLMLATPSHLSQESRFSIHEKLLMEQNNQSKSMGNFFTGINSLTSKKILLVVFSFIKNKEYLHTYSSDMNRKYLADLQRSSLDINKGRESFNVSSDSIKSNFSYVSALSSCCDSITSDKRNLLMYEKAIGSVDITLVSKIPYIFTVACKWECLSVLLKSITSVVSQYFDDFVNLVYLLTKYRNIFFEISRAMAILDKDIANELQPLILKFLPSGVNNKSEDASSSLNIPFDISLDSYPTALDEVLSIDDDSMNDFDAFSLNVLKRGSIATVSRDPLENIFYDSGNDNLSFISSNESSIMDLATGKRNIIGTGSVSSCNTDDDANLSLNTSTVSSKQLIVKETVNDNFMPQFYNNATYNAINCPRPLGMTKKRIKKMIVKHSDNFKQPITTANQNNKGFWFLGSRYLIFLITFVNKVNDVMGLTTFEGLQGDNETKAYLKRVSLQKMSILKDKKIVSTLPLEMSYYINNLYVYPRVDYDPIAYQYLQTLVWSEIFNNCSVEYKYFSDEISGNADLFYNLNTNHASGISIEEGNSTPSSPMLERWNSNNSLSRMESNASGSSRVQTHEGIQGKDALTRGSNRDSSCNEAYLEQLKYSTFMLDSVDGQSSDLNFVVSSGFCRSLKWFSTNVKMFPVKKTETNEFSLMDYTSNFLSRFKLRNSVVSKTPEEIAAEEMKRVYTPRSSISSATSRK